MRITTRVREDDIGEALFSTLHEAGHALYEQGVERRRSTARRSATGASAGVHESQSRLWENVVGRSRGFWEHYLSAAAATLSRTSSRAWRSTRSIAPSTRSSAR